MADISAIKPAGAGGASYNFKDAAARVNINILFGQDEALDTRVTALEDAPSGGGVALWASDDMSSDPSGDWGFSDCDYAAIYEASIWGDGEGDQPTLYTRYPTYTYYNSSEDIVVKVGELKVGDVIMYNSNFYYVTGLATVTQPSEDFSGKTNTFKVAKCFIMKAV